MRLSDLLKGICSTEVETSYNGQGLSFSDPEIGSVHYSAQNVREGGLFVAIKGFAADGHDFIDLALAKGAVAVVTEKPVKKKGIFVQVKNTRRALSMISARFFHDPSMSLVVVGITGTNGKTTTAFLLESILQKAGFEVGVIGTINYRYCGKIFDNPMTTPESADLHLILSEMLKAGVTHVVMEVSSHALDLYRVDHCWFDAGIFTNLTRDHLDYHKDMETYWSCKKKMFTENLRFAPKEKTFAVINCDDSRGKELYDICEGHKISVGLSKENIITPLLLREDLTSTLGRFSCPGTAFDFKSSLVGRHNLQNIACAVGGGIALGIDPDSIRSGIEALKYVPGRLEPVLNRYDRFIYVDYAHTPDALKHVLLTLKEISLGKLICVFGCGGNRDKGKRFLMGKVAGSFSDLAVITSDNPRNEEPMGIINDIIKGISENRHYVQEDRKSAIELALGLSEAGDTILIAGKGPEPYQIIGGKSFPFDDREETKKAINRIWVQ
ncbi:MAG TPA: UDP-N-acetylmuramoyl-L-alanyl-D-glutamate--2,6-diaminopimelate ligase [Desulfobacteraceae bacterium]|nr:UDP-N-acetylmuramoyl-L-alanyl-D-glutamate--2,6-diaminopimelate ligase [Desulfobacteraceae bacterium]